MRKLILAMGLAAFLIGCRDKSDTGDMPGTTSGTSTNQTNTVTR